MKRKSIREFIKENRKDIRQFIQDSYKVTVTNDKDTEQWVLNDECLYDWARKEGVSI